MLCQFPGQARIVRFEQEITRPIQQHLPIGGRVIACIQAINHLQCRIVSGQDKNGITQQIPQPLRAVDVTRIQVHLNGLIVRAEVSCRHLIAFFTAFAREVPLAFELVALAVGNQPALVNIDHQPPDGVPCSRLAHQQFKLNVPQLLHVFLAKARQIVVDWRLVRKAFQPQITGGGPFGLQRFIDGLGMPTAHHQRGNHRLRLIDPAVFDFLHRHFQRARQQAIQSNFMPLLEDHHQKCRDGVIFPFCALICYCFHRMTSWVVSVGTKTLSRRGHSFPFAQNLLSLQFKNGQTRSKP